MDVVGISGKPVERRGCVNADSETHSLSSVLWGHIRLARISNLPTVITNVAAGAALADALWGEAFSPLALLVLSLAMALFYTAGMYLNDYVDYGVDCRERPERPLPTGVISRKTALRFVIGYFVVGLLLVAYARLWALIPGVVLVGVIVLYDCWHKNNPLSHWTMALARSLVYVTVFVALGGTDITYLLIAALLMLLYVAGLTYIARSETGSDFRRYWPILLLLLPAAYFWWQTRGLFLLVPVAFAMWCGWSLWFVYRGKNKSIGDGIVRLIAGIALLDAMVLAAGGFGFLAAAAVCMFMLTRSLQGFVAGG